MRRMVLAPLLALALMLSVTGIANADDDDLPEGPVQGYVSNIGHEVEPPGPQEIGATGWYRDKAVMTVATADGALTLPDGTTVPYGSTTTVRRVYNQAFFAFMTGDFGSDGWKGFAVGRHAATIGDSQCSGPASVRYSPGYVALPDAVVTCDGGTLDGATVVLHWRGQNLMNNSFDNVTGEIR